MRNVTLKSLIAFCVLAAATSPNQAAAQSATQPAAGAAEPLGRIFFTPEQRARLDVARAQRARTTLATEKNSEDAAPSAQFITYGGMVRRSDGKSTVWINNQPVNDKGPAGGAILIGRVRPDGGISLQVPQSGRSVDLKPGQSVELLSGAVEDGFARKPMPPEPKPSIKPPAPDTTSATPAATPARAGEALGREEQRKLEEAVRTLQESAARSRPAPAR